MAYPFNPSQQFYSSPSSQQQQQLQQQQQQLHLQRKSLSAALPQQQQFPGYDARMMMMMPPPPPQQQQQQQRPPSTRPGTANRQSLPLHHASPPPHLQQQQQQQQQQPQQQQRFPSQGPFDPQYQQSPQFHQQHTGQQQFLGDMSSPMHVQQPQQQSLSSQPQPQAQPSDGRFSLHSQSQLQIQQSIPTPAMAYAQAQAQLHQHHQALQHQSHSGQSVTPGTPTSMQQSPSLRKRKVPHSPSPAPSQHHSHPPQTVGAAPAPFKMLPPVDPKRPQSSSTVGVPPGPNNLPPLGLSLNPAITRTTTLPLAGSGVAIPPLSQDDLKSMKEWIDRDKAYEKACNASRERANRELAEALRAKIGWWEEEVTPRHSMDRERFGILWPDRKRKERLEKLRRAGIRSQGLRFPSRLRNDLSNRKEDLIPIRLELDVEHHKLRETFVWNVNDPLVKPETFAQSIVDDFKLASHYVHTIAKAIHEQLQEHVPEQDEVTPISNGVLDSNGEVWWGAWRKRIRTERGYVRTAWESEDDADDESPKTANKTSKKRKTRRMLGVDVPEIMGDVPMSVEELRPKEPVSSLGMDEEWRVLIKIDILVGSMKLEDQFEWDLACTSNSPEQFAVQYTAELGLSGEFTTAIAHQIREQVYAYRKAILSGLAGQPVEDDELRPTFLPPLTRSTLARTFEGAHAHMPLLNYMSDGEIERNEREREKEIKRKRRTVRSKAAGGVSGSFTLSGRIIPDRTYRTSAIGFSELDNSALSGQGPQGSTSMTTTTSRRAAAAAASVTIANMVASENGGSPVQMNLPDPFPIRPIKETPKKGLMPPPQQPSQPPQRLFKPPPLPSNVYRTRAKLTALPASTSLDPSRYKRRSGTAKDGADNNLDDDDDASLLPPPPPPPLPPARLTAKQLRDMEKEAKEREYAEGQHENMIDGVWHCSNCGCPENIAVGRRKGPLGDKSQCGPCGKFYHRHRRPRPVEYRIDAEYHSKLRIENEKGKGGVGKRKAAGARTAAPSSEAARKKGEKEEEKDLSDEDVKEQAVKPVSTGSNADVSHNNNNNNDNDISNNINPSNNGPSAVSANAASPTDSSSSEEPPLASKNAGEKPRSESLSAPIPEVPAASGHNINVNISASTNQPPSLPPLPPSPLMPQASPPITVSKPATTKVPVQRPDWLKRALDEMQSRYVDDKFDVVLRKSTDPNAPPEWRVKCLDCPGKLYTPGPDETLANFDVHLKNRNHRAKVNARINNTTLS